MLDQESIIVTKDGKYHLYEYKNEEELGKMILEHSSEIFGKNICYFEIKKKIKSKSGFGTIPDGYVIDFDKKKLYIIEFELISHDLRKHILPQITSFIMALENENSQEELVEIFEEELNSSNKVTRNDIKSIVANFGIIILIDEVGDPMTEINPLLEIVNFLSKHGEVIAIPFQTYIKGSIFSQDHIHLFKSFTKEELEKESKKWTFKWVDVPAEKNINKLDDDSKIIFEKLREKICNLSQNIKEVHRHNWITFQISKLGNFCTIKFPKGKLEIYLKANKNFKDEKKMTKDIKRTPSWTFDKVFTIKSHTDIDYAISLIEQAYQCICKLKNKI